MTTEITIPFELRSLNAKEAGILLGQDARYVTARLSARADFPKRCSPRGAQPRWKAADLIAWRDRMKEEGR